MLPPEFCVTLSWLCHVFWTYICGLSLKDLKLHLDPLPVAYLCSFVIVAIQFMRYVLYSSSYDACSASKFSVIMQKCTGQKFGHITVFKHCISFAHQAFIYLIITHIFLYNNIYLKYNVFL